MAAGAGASTTRAQDARDGAGSPARLFAGSRELTVDELSSAPLRWPRPSTLTRPVALSGRALAGAQTLGVGTVGELLEHLPREHREARTVAALAPGEQATLTVEVRAIASRPVRRRGMRGLVEATVSDQTGTMRAVFFNQPWLVDRYPPGTRLVLYGTAQHQRRFTVATHAPAEAGGGAAAGAAASGAAASGAAASGTPAASAAGRYAATEGITSTQILALVRAAAGALADVVEPLPGSLRARNALPDRRAALAALHFPTRPQEPEEGRARLAFEELLLVQLAFLRRRERRRHAHDAPALRDGPSLTARWLSALPFALTGDQRAALTRIDADLACERPMQRLLMGEVGSGKTVVAVHAMLRAVEHGHQAALMAPTETLAEQHFATLTRLLGSEPLSVALLTGSTPGRRRAETVARLASGELALVVGTHALIEPDVTMRSLAVVVVDEQHRFGVRQREALGTKGASGPEPVEGATRPHVLYMSATPIPRTLALSRYGDLDVTCIRELPAGRKPIATRIVSGDAGRAQAYELLRGQLRAGRQAFVVCPLVEEAEDGSSEARAATVELQRLSGGELRGFQLVLLHGQMAPRERQEAIAAFAEGHAGVLVATTVIEVGIDVPNATVMLIEDADRFGISQLHQLRGRVGRGEHPSTCLLMGHSGSRRLRALERHDDGMRLAEIDLLLRKEGELIGTRQSGVGQFSVARLPDDRALLLRARTCAKAIMRADPLLRAPEHVLLADALAARFGAEQLAPIPA